MPPEIDWGSETTCKVMIANTIKILTSRAILQSKKVSLVHQYQICHHKILILLKHKYYENDVIAYLNVVLPALTE